MYTGLNMSKPFLSKQKLSVSALEKSVKHIPHKFVRHPVFPLVNGPQEYSPI